ncbi:guanine nucleotide-binding protein g(s) subunit alpha [Plakobranchus ocellatus]|uniref:Guanine nucleotide-binding protein G(s) subunit alpha n=1 Tax=Plakobranchus ocellatus TaxID=259542 RepID=A0AAV4AWG7_9GAST|nr:guanine nucleotide-binding protein g(s) subunit alpha [Plakobranchus ocellatus]
MQQQVMACFGGCGPEGEGGGVYLSSHEAKIARMRDKELTKLLNKHHKEDMKRLKLLLLGTGESGKSTITKQMKIIHINGYSFAERLEKIKDIIRNVRESLLSMVGAMHQLNIPLQNEESRASADFMLNQAARQVTDTSDEFWDHCERLWADPGVQQCYDRSHEYQLIDCAKYFLDKIGEIRSPNYAPSDQDILRCRAITTSIQHIEFDVPDAGQNVKFSVYDVGGQQGERKKWIQVFDSVVAILYLGDTSCFDQTLREDTKKSRLIESLEIFEQVWNNRFLRPVSILLFLNKIDILAEKIAKGRKLQQFLDQHPGVFPDYETSVVSSYERMEFVESFPGGHEHTSKRRSRSSSRTDINPDVVKTAVYIKNLFTKIVRGELSINKTIQPHPKEWHQNHSCEYFYTCAVDTNNVKKVLEGCRTLIIRKHLERFGIL